MPKVRVLWVMGSVKDEFSGVHLYSKIIFDELVKKSLIELSVLYNPHCGRSFKRYFFQFFVVPWRLFKLKSDFDCVVLYQESLSFLAFFSRIFGLKTVLVYHHSPVLPDCYNLIDLFKIGYLRWQTLFCRFANLIVTPSVLTRDQLGAALKMPDSNFAVVPNPFVFSDVDRFVERKNMLLESYPQLSSGRFIILNVGTDESRKNLYTLYAAMAKLPRDILLVRIGRSVSSSNKQLLTNLAIKESLNVLSIDSCDNETLNTLYQLSSIYVSPSIHEGFGRTVIEAQYYGLPVVASKIAVYDEILGSTYYPVSDFLDPEAWVSEINCHIGSISNFDKNFSISNASKYLAPNVADQFYKAVIDK